MLKNHLLNLRPYSWIDLILVGFLAKFSITRTLAFEVGDLYLAAGLLSLWFFFNLALELKHGYKYREKVSIGPVIFFLLLSLAISWMVNYLTVAFCLLSAFLMFIYLQKAKNKFFGNTNSVVRGLVQVGLFFFALSFFTTSISISSIAIGGIIFLLYLSRAVVGDLRDEKQNKKSNKQTLPVTLGVDKCKILVISLLLASIILQLVYFDSYLVTVPIALFALLLVFNSNGYVLHQLMILTTSFFHINMISFFTNQNLIFVNLIYLGIYLNLVFYPLLKRKSNPKFVQEGN